MNDNEIISLYWQRSESAIAETDKKYGSYCHAIAWRILENHEDAGECVNDTWLGAWRSMPPHRPERLATFLGKITRNLAFNRYRDEKRKKRGGGQMTLVLEELGECVPDRVCVESRVESLTFAECFNGFLENLSREDRALFLRRYWYAEPIKELAGVFRMSESAVKTRLFRLRAKLKTELEKAGIEV